VIRVENRLFAHDGTVESQDGRFELNS